MIDKVKYLQSLKEIVIDIPEQSAITKDNVGLRLDGVLYLKIFDPYKASYGVDDAEHAITQLAQTTMRSELGKIVLDSVFKERESLNTAIVGRTPITIIYKLIYKRCLTINAKFMILRSDKQGSVRMGH